jgi:hypothetical protein
MMCYDELSARLELGAVRGGCWGGLLCPPLLRQQGVHPGGGSTGGATSTDSR